MQCSILFVQFASAKENADNKTNTAGKQEKTIKRKVTEEKILWPTTHQMDCPI